MSIKHKTLNVLGVSFLSDAGACLVRDGRIASAANEERFNRIKLWYGIPERSIEYVLNDTGVKLEDIDLIALHCKSFPFVNPAPFLVKARKILFSKSIGAAKKRSQLAVLFARYVHESRVLAARTPGYIRKMKSFGRPLRIVDHHVAHAASAYFTSGWDECKALTIDGWGENSSNLLASCSGGKIYPEKKSNTFDSLGYFYGSITKSLGFKPHRHEGKILGLAAFGDPAVAYDILKLMVGFDPAKQSFVGRMEDGLYVPRFDNSNLKSVVDRFEAKHVAAAAQKVLEEVVLEYVKNLKGKNLKLALAGGIFANVKLNQRLLELDSVDEIFIHPNMGDGGLAAGAALQVYSEIEGLKPYKLDNVYYGCDFGDKEIRRALEREGAKASREDDIDATVAELLAGGRIVARFSGRMEYGPRALGNRSILYQATDPTVNDWLNKKLARTEFMPFAPVTLDEEAERCYVMKKDGRYPARFMTITFDCTEWMKKTSPAVAHVDGTARPQLVRESDNPGYYKILKKYYEKTGIPSLINTSFNMHEEPIVCTPSDALRAFRESELDYLAIGNFLVEKREP